jgi:opacity protein-like surface antigen
MTAQYKGLLALAILSVSAVATAQESLATCSAQKNQQMELIRNIKLAPEPSIDPYTHRSYSRFDKTRAQADVNRIDEWLWKNCREYSNELRSIEQQYM